MNRPIFRFPNRVKKKIQNQFAALNVDSVVPRHTMVYVWETLQQPYHVLSSLWYLLHVRATADSWIKCINDSSTMYNLRQIAARR